MSKIVATSCDRYMKKNENQQTPLAEAILRRSESIEKYLKEGAAASIFVKGYFPGSLVCTLPMALQPASKSFEHPPPVTNVKADVIDSIDKAMADRIADLIVAKAARAASGLNGMISSKDGTGNSSTPRKKGPVFNHYPPILKVGDFVRRGPNWSWGSQDHKKGPLPCVGTVVTVGTSDPTQISVQWGEDPLKYDGNNACKAAYRYDPANSFYDLCMVDPANQSVNPVGGQGSTTGGVIEKLKVGDKVRLGPKLKGSTLVYWNHDLAGTKTTKFVCKGCGKNGPSTETGTKSCQKCQKCEKCCLFGSDYDGWSEKQFKDAGNVALKNIDGSKNVIQPDYKIIFKNFGTCVGNIKLHATAEMSKYYYEVESKDYKSSMQFGWITEGFKAIPDKNKGKGVGDDAYGWAVDGNRSLKWTSNGSTSYGSSISDGHFIGIAIDLEARTISASLNGNYGSPWGVAFTDIEVPAGWVMPAFSACDDSKYTVNFGDRPFKHKPPDSNYLSVHAAHRVIISMGSVDDNSDGDKIDHNLAQKTLSDECMGASADERVGVIVKTCAADVEKSKEASVNCCRSGSVPTRFTVVTVMSTATGALCDYIEDDLVYADGSIAAPLDAATAKPPTIGPPSLPSAAFRSIPLRFGDRVILSPTFTANGGDGWCLGRQMQTSPGSGAAAITAGGMAPTEGVVLFAPDSPFSMAFPDQRGVLVTAVDDETKIYCFRSSWLSRAAIDGSRVFELGDRVQLAVELPSLHAPVAAATTGSGGFGISGFGSSGFGAAASAPPNTDKEIDSCDPRVDGKCLGKISDSQYGRVVSVGVIREGIQRNIEVVAVGGPYHGQVSLYPAYALAPAVRHAVMTDHDLSLLHATVRHFLTSHGLTSVDVDQLIATFGGNVWSRVLDLATSVKGIHKDVVVGAWEAWNRARDLGWPADGPTLDAIEAIYDGESAITTGAAASRRASLEQGLAYRLPPPPPPPAHWTCASPRCQFTDNVPSKAKCVLCKQKAPKWQCKSCTAENRPTAYACVACFSHRDFASDAVVAPDDDQQTAARATRVLPAPFQRLAAAAVLEAKSRGELMAAAKTSAQLSSTEGAVDVKKATVLGPPKTIEVGATFRVKNVSLSEAQILFSAASNSINSSMPKTFGMEGTVSSYSGGENLTLQFGSPINEMWSYPITMLELEEEVEANDSDDSDEEDDDENESNGANSDQEAELGKNSELAEAYFHGSEVDLGTLYVLPAASISGGLSGLGPISSIPPPPFPISRENSEYYVQTNHYEPIDTIDALLNSADKNGNGAAHHAASIGLTRTARALFDAGASRWRANVTHDTPQSALDGLPLGSGKERNRLFVAITARHLLPQTLSRHVARNANFAHQPSPEFAPMVAALLNPVSGEQEADYYSQKAMQDNIPGAPLYRALFMLTFGFGEQQAQPLLDAYLQQLLTAAGNSGEDSAVDDNTTTTATALTRTISGGAGAGSTLGATDDSIPPSTSIDPLYFYARYLVWKLQRSHAKAEKLMAADALQAFRLFDISSKFLTRASDSIGSAGEDNIDEQLASLGLLKPPEGTEAEEEEDAYAELIPPPGPDDPETLWDVAKRNFKLHSPAMDTLMALAGLKKVKERALTVAMEVLTKNQRPPDQKPPTMNFLFVGNPGCGKTTVAQLLATAMVELKYRANPTPICTSAPDILAGSDPAVEFDEMVKKAEGGTLFIDEAYMFTPAPRGQRSNDSNKVLDLLLKVTESMRENTTFILAGYKEEIGQLLGYNQGFKSRFPREFTFEFEDYSEAQLCQILCTMGKQHKYRFESQKTCGVPIARVLARRMHRGAGKKGFGNGRLCEKILDSCKVAQTNRLGKLKLRNIPITVEDYMTLTRADTVGERPQLESSAYYRQLMSMVGLHRVKEQMKSLINLQLQNFDSEMRGDKPQLISLHRVFFGNPGTGKTTVARLYGKLLKECGFLSDGDFVEVKPSDLKGQAVGEAATTTSNILAAAKGKVLFIDEAYGLDPSRRSNNDFGGDVIDTLVEQIEGTSGQDLAVIFAGYKPQMEELFRNCQNPGLKRRFNLEEGLYFEDFNDDELRKILKDLIVNSSLSVDPSTLDYAVKLISMRRRLDDFGNAGECSALLDRAKMKLSSRKAKGGMIPRPNHLIMDDFTGEETTAEKAKQAFADLEATDHIMEIINELQDTMTEAKAQGRDPADIVDGLHMIFTGPPGTGKTTSAKRFGVAFKNLELLPRSDVEVVTAANLISRYVGGTGNNVIDAMRRAKGGILFIDEAYGMLPRNGSFGADAIQALLDNITMPEFQGKLLVVLGGYEEDVEKLFDINPGFRSRFDKRRLHFPEWAAETAVSAMIKASARDRMKLTVEAEGEALRLFNILRSLPHWASARDFDTVYKNMFQKRARRLGKLLREKNAMRERSHSGSGNNPTPPDISNPKLPTELAAPLEPFEAEDVQAAFESIIKSRGGDSNRRDHSSGGQGLGGVSTSVSQGSFDDTDNIGGGSLGDRGRDRDRDVPSRYDSASGGGGRENNGGGSYGSRDGGSQGGGAGGMSPSPMYMPPKAKAKAKTIVKVLERRQREDGGDDDNGPSDKEVWSALEDACLELNLDLDELIQHLERADFPSSDIVDIVMRKTGCNEKALIGSMLKDQRPTYLKNMKAAQTEIRRQKTALEQKKLEKVRALGLCEAGFEWIKCEGGYRCGGGSHFCSDDQVNMIDLN